MVDGKMSKWFDGPEMNLHTVQISQLLYKLQQQSMPKRKNIDAFREKIVSSCQSVLSSPATKAMLEAESQSKTSG
jgi:hypothetical protein